MVIWDTNILALYFGKRLGQDDQLRMAGLVAELKRKREPIGIPAQVWAEFLDAASPEELAHSQDIFKTSAFRLLPYDLRAAMETVEVSRSGRDARKATKGKKRERQAVKVDWQIIAIGKLHRARLLLTNDGDMQLEAVRSGLTCKAIAELEIPDDLRQHAINYEPAPEVEA
ncbi:nuclease [Pseudomonas sp. C9-3]|uniref:nuclease n=1 Tax=Pseudomonas sp. C9-3 TaxID=3078264 RepID=UPI0028E324F2|nr:nuclease [Pseudomonas sp. C9-3]